MGSQHDIASFVLRFKQHYRKNDRGEPRLEWRGHIRHVQHDTEKCFTELHEAMAYIQDVLLGQKEGAARHDDSQARAAALARLELLRAQAAHLTALATQLEAQLHQLPNHTLSDNQAAG